MSNQFINSYHHKKFDQRKRRREGGDSVSTNQSTDYVPRPAKQRRLILNSNQRQTGGNKLPKRIQLINFSQESIGSTSSSSPTMLFPFPLPSNADNFTADKRFRIKEEPIDANDETYTPINFKIKEEFIEPDTQVPAITTEAYKKICKFRSSMVRHHPNKDRSAKEQERRNRNTNSCRKSRRKKRIEEVAVEEEYKGLKEANARVTEYTIRATAYVMELMKMTQAASSDANVIVVD